MMYWKEVCWRIGGERKVNCELAICPRPLATAARTLRPQHYKTAPALAAGNAPLFSRPLNSNHRI